MRRHLLLDLGAWSLGLLCPAPALGAQAQTYATKPVALIVPYASGAATDLLGRVVAQIPGNALGQSVVVQSAATER